MQIYQKYLESQNSNAYQNKSITNNNDVNQTSFEKNTSEEIERSIDISILKDPDDNICYMSSSNTKKKYMIKSDIPKNLKKNKNRLKNRKF